MAVKANASVTIADVSDGIDGTGIKSTTIEYQAGSSGTSAPTGTWYKSPPSTTAANPYMWTRVTYVYTDGSNKIVYSVGSTPEGIEIGGRNLLRNTNRGSVYWSFSMYDGASTVESYLTDDGVNAVKMTCTVPSSGWQMILYKLDDVVVNMLEANTTYVLSFDILTNMKVNGCGVSIRHTNSTNLLTNTPWYGNIHTDETWNKIKCVLQTNDLSADKKNQYVYITGFNLEGYLIIKNLKLEYGNKATDWTPAPEDIENKVNDLDEELHQTIVDQKTSIISDTEKIILSALESYVDTDTYNELKTTVNAQLSIMADEINMKFSNVTENVGNVNSDVQAKFSELYKYISFSGENGIVIGNGQNQITLKIDTDGIHFSKNGEDFGFWDGNDFYTGNIMVRTTERAQFGNYAFIPRSDGSLMFLKVGG